MFVPTHRKDCSSTVQYLRSFKISYHFQTEQLPDCLRTMFSLSGNKSNVYNSYSKNMYGKYETYI